MPVGPYAISKAEAEVKLLDIASKTGLEVVIIRPPLIYGKGVKANFSLLIRAIRAGLPLPFGRVFENRRSMVSLANLVDFIFLCYGDHRDLHYPLRRQRQDVYKRQKQFPII